MEKTKKRKEKLPAGAIKLRRYFMMAFICIAALGIAAGILYRFGYI